jgi:hypothetical protein
MEPVNKNARDGYDWMKVLEQRERMEILYALNYIAQFNHGTSGHLGLTTLAKVAQIATHALNALEVVGHEISEVELESWLAVMSVAPRANPE